jgi:predicted dienelactone hydrolase
MVNASHAQVGLRQIQSGSLTITLVYPTTVVSQPSTQGAFTLQVASNAPPLPAATGKRHLIVLSHGTAGSALPDHTLAATLARAGFVVAQPEHRGDNWQDFSRAGPESWKTRPQDVSETIDAVARDPELVPLVDTHRVGVHGMSAGGATGLVLAGAQWRMLNLVQHCAQHLEEDIGFCLNGLAGHTWLQLARRAQFTMARFLSEGNAPAAMTSRHGGKSAAASQDPRPDPRIAVVSLSVPVGVIFTPESLARIRIPLALSTSGDDGVLLPRFHSQHVLKHCTSCTLLSDHPTAGHFDWLSPWPASVAQTVAATQMRGGLPNPSFTDADRQKAFDQIALFFKQKL